jgi:cell division protein FtsQ
VLRRLAPSRRSLAVGLGILGVAIGGYLIASETSIFALDRIDVRGGSAQVDAQVQQALGGFVGRSMVGLDGGDVIRRLDALPTVVSASYDRAFPHTLSVTIVAEQPVAVLRAGTSAWLVSARGRLMARLAATADAKLPRLWLSSAKTINAGDFLSAAGGGMAARALGAAGAFRSRVATASVAGGELAFHLRSGIQLLLGTGGAIPLKVAVAVRALRALPSGARFVDVSVPSRPVAGVRIPAPTVVKGSTRG